MYCEKLLTPRELISPAVIEIADGVVTAVGAASIAPPSAIPVDGVVMPGLVDLQVNGFGGDAVTGGDAEAIERISSALLAVGVTAWLPTIVTCTEERRLASLDAVHSARRQVSPRSARILGAHVEGPWISRHRAGAHDVELIEPPEEGRIARTLSRHEGIVRIVTLAPEIPGGIEAVRQVVASGAIASLGHTDASYEVALEAVDAGARMVTHIFNAMRPLHHREPGVIAAALVDERIVAGLIADGVHLHPASIGLVLRIKHHQVALVSDVVPGEVEAGSAARLEDGTLAGSLSGLDEGVRVAFGTGCSLTDSVTAATRTPAALLGEPCGRLAPGAPADLVVMSSDLRPQATYIGGELAWST